MTESKQVKKTIKGKEETVRIPLSEYRALQEKNEALRKKNESIKKELEKRTLDISQLNKNDKKKMERCISIYQFIDSHPNCKRNEIIEGTGLPEGTIKRYLYNMVHCSLPYIESEGRGPATTYKIFSLGLCGPTGKNNLENLKKHLKEWYNLKKQAEKHGEKDFPSLNFFENPSSQLKEIINCGNRSILFGPKNKK